MASLLPLIIHKTGVWGEAWFNRQIFLASLRQSSQPLTVAQLNLLTISADNMVLLLTWSNTEGLSVEIEMAHWCMKVIALMIQSICSNYVPTIYPHKPSILMLIQCLSHALLTNTECTKAFIIKLTIETNHFLGIINCCYFCFTKKTWCILCKVLADYFFLVSQGMVDLTHWSSGPAWCYSSFLPGFCSEASQMGGKDRLDGVKDSKSLGPDILFCTREGKTETTHVLWSLLPSNCFKKFWW